MRFAGHPFDYMDLLVDLRFVDNSWMVEGHPGVQLVASSLSDRVSGGTNLCHRQNYRLPVGA